VCEFVDKWCIASLVNVTLSRKTVESKTNISSPTEEFC
jgi:hypothetical protein